jgi:hypothetical protein
MGIHDEFLEILRVLLEVPEPAGKKPPSTEGDQRPEAASEVPGKRVANNKREGAGS